MTANYKVTYKVPVYEQGRQVSESIRVARLNAASAESAEALFWSLLRSKAPYMVADVISVAKDEVQP